MTMTDEETELEMKIKEDRQNKSVIHQVRRRLES